MDGNDGFPGLAPQFPPGSEPQPRSRLVATLRRIDGWGPRAWREVSGAWRLRHGVMALDDTESGVGDDEGAVACHLVLDAHGLGDEEPVATCDWVLRSAWAGLLPRAGIDASTYRPTAMIQATNACFMRRPTTGGSTLYLRLVIRLPFAGMCCDGKRFLRFVTRLETFAGSLSRARERPTLAAHRRAVAVQRALRAALPGRGLVAFLADGSRLARRGDGAA
ncbi:MAG: hypothetical protein H0V44_03645, partial [Planctomycetes bacterium]|nr:hypothetical protein [Planctomycetota bacterium]